MGVVVHDAPREVALARRQAPLEHLAAGLPCPPPGRPGRALRERSRVANVAQELVHQAPRVGPGALPGVGQHQVPGEGVQAGDGGGRLGHRPQRIERGGAAVVPLHVGVEHGRQAPERPVGGAVRAGQGGDGGEAVAPQVAQKRQLPQHLIRRGDPVAAQDEALAVRLQQQHQVRPPAGEGRHGEAPGRPPEAGQEVPAPPPASSAAPAVARPVDRLTRSVPPRGPWVAPAGGARRDGRRGPPSGRASRYRVFTSRRRALNTLSLRLRGGSQAFGQRPFSQTSIAAEVTGGEGEQPPLLRGYTCLSCGHRSATWAAFRAHRRECPNPPARPGGAGRRCRPGARPGPGSPRRRGSRGSRGSRGAGEPG